ncbi:MAG: prolipoprotein diacylglyceryl transferase [Sedimentisphaerales bacterium]|nr:prolipoprotein diacylglyceryl transferase [Sedimentisphaerales bacterium]
MRPELFTIPLPWVDDVTVKGYGMMMVIGFMLAVTIIRRLSRSFTPDPQLITNAALYSLIGGVVGARIFYVIHYPEQFRGDWLGFFKIWYGGLELLGGVILAISIILFYLWYHKLPIRRYLDVLAIGLLFALLPGRVGCFLNGCCWGKPTTLPWGVRFPYNSLAFNSQINPDPQRHRSEPYLKLPKDEYLGFLAENGKWYPKSFDELTNGQKYEVTKGKYRCLPVHPTQLYASLAGGISGLLLYLLWRRANKLQKTGKPNAILAKPGQCFALMFILYGVTRFALEFIRDDNPFEYGPWVMNILYVIYRGGTVSQNISIYLVALGLILLVVFQKLKTDELKNHTPRKS